MMQTCLSCKFFIPVKKPGCSVSVSYFCQSKILNGMSNSLSVGITGRCEYFSPKNEKGYKKMYFSLKNTVPIATHLL